VTALILAIVMELQQVLLRYGCQQPRIFALEREVVLSCEAGEWNSRDIIPRASVLLSSLAFTYPYGKRFSLVLRKFKVPKLQITVDRKDIIEFLSGKIEDFPQTWRVYSLDGKVFRLHGLAMSIISSVVNPLQQRAGKIKVENFYCRDDTIHIELSYSLVDKARLMLIMEEEERKITRIFNLKGSGKAHWKLKAFDHEIGCKLYVWEGNWGKIWEGKTKCKKEGK